MLETIREYGLERLVADEPGAATVASATPDTPRPGRGVAGEPLRAPTGSMARPARSRTAERARRTCALHRVGKTWSARFASRARTATSGTGAACTERPPMARGTLALVGEPSPARVRAWLALGNCCHRARPISTLRRRRTRAALRDARELGDGRAHGNALNNLGTLAWERGDWSAATERFITEAMELVDESSADAAMFLANLGTRGADAGRRRPGPVAPRAGRSRFAGRARRRRRQSLSRCSSSGWSSLSSGSSRARAAASSSARPR